MALPDRKCSGCWDAGDKMTPKNELFCRRVVENGGDKKRAYIEVYRPKNENSVAGQVTAIMKRPGVADRISELQAQVSTSLVFGIHEVLREWTDIALAEATDLVNYRRVNCRHCWGKGHKFQWSAPMEFADRQAAWIHTGSKGTKPSDEGGYGYTPLRDPNASCPFCHGLGEEFIQISDTTKLTGRAKKLFAGLKKTKDGIEIKMRDQDGSLRNIAQALGVFAERVVVTPPEQPPMPAMPDDPTEASRIYAEIVKG